MTPNEAFTFGFLYKCAEQGVPPAIAEKALDFATATVQKKQAFWGELGTSASRILSAPLVLGATALGAGGVSGLAAGHFAKKQELAEALDPAEIQHQEMLDAYRMHTQNILRQMADEGMLPKRSPEETRKLREQQALRRSAAKRKAKV